MHPTEETLIPRLIFHSDSKPLTSSSSCQSLLERQYQPLAATPGVQADPPLLSYSNNIAVKWGKKKSSSFQFSCMAFGSFLGLYLQTGAQETEVPVCFSYDRRSHPQPQLLWPTSALCFEESTDYQTLAAAGLVHGQGHSAGVCTSSPCIFPTAPSWLCSSQGGYGWHQDV